MSAESVATENADAFNAGDWERFAAGCASEIVYAEQGSNRSTRGVEAFVELAQGWKAAVSDLSGSITRTIATDSAAVLEINWTGTHDGPLDLPTGKLPATGRPIQIEAATVVTVENDRITHMSNHVDLLSFLVQVGAIPGSENIS